ncbi:MAG: FxsA family protein [Nitrospinota bacterium]|nr:FxsA family protein [Nitrospinota bacterium]
MLQVAAFFALGTGIELYGLKWISESISIMNTISWVMFSFLVGIIVSRSYGDECLERIQRSLKSREAPVDDVLNGAVMSLCSMLLITPGLITDTIGLLIMIPATRGLFKGMALNFTQKRIQAGRQYFFFKD